MTALVDRITAVMSAHRPRRIRGNPEVEECIAGCKYEVGGCYEHFAEQVAAELNLTEEWGVQITEGDKTVIETHPGVGEPLDRDTAFYENRRWPSFGYNTEGVRHRWVSEWAPVEEAS